MEGITITSAHAHRGDVHGHLLRSGPYYQGEGGGYSNASSARGWLFT